MVLLVNSLTKWFVLGITKGDNGSDEKSVIKVRKN